MNKKINSRKLPAVVLLIAMLLGAAFGTLIGSVSTVSAGYKCPVNDPANCINFGCMDYNGTQRCVFATVTGGTGCPGATQCELVGEEQ